MRVSEAADLIRGGEAAEGGTWADLGAGSGTFTRALATLLGSTGTVHAVDRAASALRELEVGEDTRSAARIEPMVADFTAPLRLSGLDGIVMANSLHFVPRDEQERVVTLVAGYLRDGGSFVLVEYDQRRGVPWVPYPVPPGRFEELASAAGLGAPRETGRRPSRYGPKDIYAAVAVKPG